MLMINKKQHIFRVGNQVGSALGQNDLLAEESGPLLPSILPAPEVQTVFLLLQN